MVSYLWYKKCLDDFKESEHPRDEDGKFIDKDGEKSSVSESEHNALKEYVSGNMMNINNAMRNVNGLSESDLNDKEKEVIKELKKATSKPISKDIKELYRGVDISAVGGNISNLEYDNLHDYLLYGSNEKIVKESAERTLSKILGKEITDKGFMSTTKDKEVAYNWDDFSGAEHPIVLKLNCENGVNGVDVDELGIEKELNPDLEDSQAEVLLQNNTKYKIIDVFAEEGNIVFKADIINKDSENIKNDFKNFFEKAKISSRRVEAGIKKIHLPQDEAIKCAEEIEKYTQGVNFGDRKLIDKAIHNSDAYGKRTCSGIEKEFDRNFNRGDEIGGRLISWSKDEDVAIDFADSKKMLVIEENPGLDISDMSYEPQEQEVLTATDMKFIVKDIQEKDGFKKILVEYKK